MIKSFLNTIIEGNSIDLLQNLPENSIDLIITSPPYFGCRQYGNETVGRELNPIEYVDRFLEFTPLIKKVLSKSGSFYLNLGDVYFGTKGFSRNSGKYKRDTDTHYKNHKICKQDGKVLQYKQLLMLPSRVAIKMQEDGWILRNDIIWEKPNAIPSFSKDRRLPRYEHIFHFVKSPKYYYNYEKSKELNCNKDIIKQTIKPFKDHKASFPVELIEKLILTTSKQGDIVLDPFSGSGTTAYTSKIHKRNYIGFEINADFVRKSKERLKIINNLWNGQKILQA